MKDIKTEVQEVVTKKKPADAAQILGDKMSFLDLEGTENHKAKAVAAMAEFFDLIPRVKGMMPKTLAESGVTRDLSYGDKVVAYRKAADQARAVDEKTHNLRFTVVISGYSWELRNYKTNMWNYTVVEWMQERHWETYSYRAKLYGEAKALMVPEKAERLLFGSYYDGSNIRVPSADDQKHLADLFQAMHDAMAQYPKGNEAQKARAQQAFNQAFAAFVKEDEKKPSFWELNMLLHQSLSAGMRVDWGKGYSLSHDGTGLEVKVQSGVFEGVDTPKTILVSRAPVKEIFVSPNFGVAWIVPCTYGGYLGTDAHWLTIQPGVPRGKDDSTPYRWKKK